jgi:hypothetical protein
MLIKNGQTIGKPRSLLECRTHMHHNAFRAGIPLSHNAFRSYGHITPIGSYRKEKPYFRLILISCRRSR